MDNDRSITQKYEVPHAEDILTPWQIDIIKKIRSGKIILNKCEKK